MMASKRNPKQSGSGTQPLMVLEFNELCPGLLSRWMSEGALPNFARLHATSDVFITDTDVEESHTLEPWIQWYSAHTGLAYDQHGVFHLTDGARAGHDSIFDLLIASGKRVASFGSMNVAPFGGAGNIYLPDPWSYDDNAHPGELDIYARFVSQNVREYSNAALSLSAREKAQFVAYMASHGLSPATVTAILRQLASEKTGDPALSWKRVMLLDRLQFNLFAHHYRRQRPDFATFFSNSVAHLQHSYWRHMDPDAFTIRPDEAEMTLYGEAVKQGYMATDALLGQCMKLARHTGARIMFATALSQQPFTRHDESGGQHFHRPHDIEALLSELGIAYAHVAPTMTHQFLLTCADADSARAARKRLAQLELEDGTQLFDFPPIEAAEGGLYFGCQINRETDPATRIIDRASNRGWSFGDVLYRIPAIKSGRHHHDGCLWIAGGSGTEHQGKVSILDILPTQLELLNVGATPRECRGSSLVRQLDQPREAA